MRALSYVHGTGNRSLISDTIGGALANAARLYGGNIALISRHQSVRWSYEELNARANTLAAAFLDLGLEPGDRIGIWAPNCAEWTLTQFAAAKAGLVLVTVNTAYRATELEYALNKVGCKAIVTGQAHRGIDYAAMLCEIAPELAHSRRGALSSTRLPHLRHAICLGGAAPQGFTPFDEIADRRSDRARASLARLSGQLQFDDPINIQFTSGTTGFPKGATLSHHNILNNGFFVGEQIGLGPTDRLCIPVPLYHCFGMVMGNLGCLTHGSAMIYPSESFDALAVLETLDAEHCTALYGVPTMFI